VSDQDQPVGQATGGATGASAPWQGSASTPPLVPPPASHGTTSRPSPWSEDRPAPALASLAGAFAGFLLLASLFLFLSELGGDSRRLVGIALSLVFEAVGVGLMVMHRNQRAATAGVLLTAIGIIPLLVYLFVDVKNPDRTIDSVSTFTSTATIILLVAAALWLVAYLVGPGRRYGFYLGAALVALWLVAIVQIIDGPLSATFDPFTSPSATFVPGPGFDTSSGSGSDPGSFDPSFDDSGPDSGTFDSSSRYRGGKDPSTKIGASSLIFGGIYLLLGARRDRRGGRRQGTVFLAVSIPILTLAVVFLGQVLEVTGAALLGLALGAAIAWLGTRTGRRFSSWYATVAMVVAVVVLVAKALGGSPRAMAAVLAVIGLGAALAVRALEDRRSTGPGSAGPSWDDAGRGWSGAGPGWGGGGGAPPSGGAWPQPAPAKNGPSFAGPPGGSWLPPAPAAGANPSPAPGPSDDTRPGSA